jgi:hypothetical protein
MTPSTICLWITYEPTSSQPVPLVRVENNELAAMVARSAIAAAESRASEVGREDRLLGEIELAEVDRLKRVLMMLVPQKLVPVVTQ